MGFSWPQMSRKGMNLLQSGGEHPDACRPPGGFLDDRSPSTTRKRSGSLRAISIYPERTRRWNAISSCSKRSSAGPTAGCSIQGSAQAGLDRQVYKDGKPGDQPAACKGVHVPDEGNVKPATESLVSDRGVGKAVAEDPAAFPEGRQDKRLHVLAAGGGKKEQLRLGPDFNGTPVQKQLTDLHAQGRPPGLTGYQRPDTPLLEMLRGQTDLSALSRSLDAFKGDEGPHGGLPSGESLTAPPDGSLKMQQGKQPGRRGRRLPLFPSVRTFVRLFILSRDDRLHRALVCTGPTVGAEPRVDYVFIIPFGDGLDGALAIAGSTGNAVISYNVSHFAKLLLILSPSLQTVCRSPG